MHQAAGRRDDRGHDTGTLNEAGAQTATLDGIQLTSHAVTPSVRANVALHMVGERRLAAAVLLPEGHDGSPLPVLLDPYRGRTATA